jgi:nitroreductase
MNQQTILSSLQWRYATKQFDTTKKISDSDLWVLLESLRLAPSSFGLQPWKFHCITNPELRGKLQKASWNQAQISDASHLLVLTARTNMKQADIDAYVADIIATRSDQMADITEAKAGLEGYKKMMEGATLHLPEAQQHQWNIRQCYIALGFLLETAALLGIDSCPMEGISTSEYDAILWLEGSGYSTVLACPIGYRSSKDAYAEYKKVRYSNEHLFVYHK